MALKDSIRVGMSLPHHSPEPIDMATVRRVAERAEALGFSTAGFGKSVQILRAELEKLGRDPAAFPISKRVFLSVDERADKARAEVDR